MAKVIDPTQNEFLQTAHRKLMRSEYTTGQRDQLLLTLGWLMDLEDSKETADENGEFFAKLLTNITNQHHLLAVIQQQAAELNALKRITINLTSSLKIQAVLEAIVTEAMQLINDAHSAHIFLFQHDALEFGASLDWTGKRNEIVSMPRPLGLTYAVVKKCQIIVVEDIKNDALFSHVPEDRVGSIVGIPLMMDKTVVGVMNMARLAVGGFSQSELRLLGLLADQAALAMINAHLHQTVENQAMNDALTGLPNRLALDTRLEYEVQRAARYKHQFAVIMMDLDGFKVINDTYGHSTGDEILRQYAQFLARSQRTSDFLARYGGDELLMILPETNLYAAEHVGEHICKRMVDFKIYLPDGANCCLSVSGGIAIYPSHAQTASDLLRAADQALYSAKRHNRGTFIVAKVGTGELISPNNDQ